jgi:hypothetical protein
LRYAMINISNACFGLQAGPCAVSVTWFERLP